MREATAADIAAIVADARPADVAEMQALGTTVQAALECGLRVSDWSLVGLVDGVPACMLGVAPSNYLAGEAMPWMLSTAVLDRLDFEFLRRVFLPLCLRGVAEMLRSYPRLVNVVDARNRRAIRWLKLLGFQFDERVYPFCGHQLRVFRAGAW